MNKQYLSNYLGIVVQNNDPEKRGRVKVWVPHISTAVYDNWNKDFTAPESIEGTTTTLDDKYFVFPDKTTNPDLDKIMPYLKDSLPWAEVAMSIFGGSASGRYNAFSRKGTTSDSNTPEPGFRPLQNYIGENQVLDAFPNNPNTKGYSPSNYSNLARGEFTIPNVGAHVWVFFIEGDANYPVIWAVSHGEEDWKRIYSNNNESEPAEDSTSVDYPASFENLALDETEDGATNHNVETFRAKHVFNSNKHSIELIDTDKAEVLKFTSFSGSFLEFNNSTTSQFAANNDQTLVLGDQYLTVRKNQNIYVANYQDTLIEGDRKIQLGNFDQKRLHSLAVLEVLRDTHEYKRLFEVQRASVGNHTSQHQLQSGNPTTCPVCAGAGTKFDDDCIVCGGTGKSPSTQNGAWKLDPFKQNDLKDLIRANQQKITNLELESGFGNGGDDIILISGNRVTTIGAAFNDLESYRVDPEGKMRANGTHVAAGGTYVTMGASPLVEYVDVDSVPGGDWDVVVGNKYRLNVGSKGIHIKTTGPIDMYGTVVNMSGEALYLTAEQEVILDGGRRLEVKGRDIEIIPEKEVLVSGNVGVAGNLKTLGGAHIEGELSYLSSSAPKQMYMTEIGYGPIPHTHIFYGPKCEFVETPEEVREDAATLNESNPAPNRKSWSAWLPS